MELAKGFVFITEEVLAGLSPYRTIHINRFGDYLMDLDRGSGADEHLHQVRVQAHHRFSAAPCRASRPTSHRATQ